MSGRPPRRSSGTRARSPLVLLVEDRAELRATLADVLAREGFSVVEARDGREAVEQARSLLPDIIVMDLSLPVLDGLAAVRVLKTFAATGAIPIVVLSGLSLSRSEVDAMALDGVLRKPCAPEALAARLHAVLRSSRRRRRGG